MIWEINRENLVKHHILNIIQGNIASFFELALSSKAKRIASTIPISFYQPALARLQGFEAPVMALFQQDLFNSIHHITYTAELADQHWPAATRRALAATTPQRSKRANTKLGLEQAEYEKAKSSDFLRKCGNTTSPNTWRMLINAWDAPTLCRFYSIQGFLCNNRACGTNGGHCPNHHKPWTQLTPLEQTKVKAIVVRFPRAITLDKTKWQRAMPMALQHNWVGPHQRISGSAGVASSNKLSADSSTYSAFTSIWQFFISFGRVICWYVHPESLCVWLILSSRGIWYWLAVSPRDSPGTAVYSELLLMKHVYTSTQGIL